jgi:hypothetical protein
MNMQQQQQEHKDKEYSKSREHVLKLDDDTYYAIKQLSSLMGYRFPITLISEIFKEYIEAHKDLLIEK